MVLGPGVLEGEAASAGLGATMREVMGEMRSAFVVRGSASRVTAGVRGFLSGLAPDPKGPAVCEEGVAGAGIAPFGRARRFVGVEGTSSTGSAFAELTFRFLVLGAGAGGAGAGLISSDLATSLAERRVAIATAVSRFKNDGT